MKGNPALLLGAALMGAGLLLDAPLARGAQPKRLQDLIPGRYAVRVTGMLCAVCAKTIVAELSKLPEVESAKADFEKDQILVTIKLERTLRLSALRRSLRLAAKRVNLGTQFEIEDMRYTP